MGEAQMAYAALALESKALLWILSLDTEIIPQEVVLQSRGRDQAGSNKDDDFICDRG